MSTKKSRGWEFKKEVEFSHTNYVNRYYVFRGTKFSKKISEEIIRSDAGEGVAPNSTNLANVWLTVHLRDSSGNNGWVTSYARPADQPGVENLLSEDFKNLLLGHSGVGEDVEVDEIDVVFSVLP